MSASPDSPPARASDFDYRLPPEQIAQAPLPQRDDARLLVLDRSAPAGVAHSAIKELPSLLPDGALLVVNDTRVIRARLRARKPTGGRVELLLVERELGPAERWSCLSRASKPMRLGPLVIEGLDGAVALSAEVLAVEGERVRVEFVAGERGLLARLDEIGEVPLPPYIHRETPDPGDRARYQTVFAQVPGAVAAPTAGLHFTPELLAALSARGIARTAITLHVGPGTFAPLRSDDLDSHVMHSERYQISDEAARTISAARAERRPIIAVGTTVVRTLESAASDGRVIPGAGETRLFIRPGFRFQVVDALLTNFHLPRSTLLMLVSAFAGRARVLSAYEEAVRSGYRFFSYGDAMLIT